MPCKHSEEGTCLIIQKPCAICIPNEQRCSENSYGVISYLKHIGTYHRVENNPKYLKKEIK